MSSTCSVSTTSAHIANESTDVVGDQLVSGAGREHLAQKDAILSM